MNFSHLTDLPLTMGQKNPSKKYSHLYVCLNVRAPNNSHSRCLLLGDFVSLIVKYSSDCQWASWWLSSKESTFNTGDVGSILELGGSPAGGHGNPLHYSCLENPMDRGAWQSMVHEVPKSWTQLKQLSTHTDHH